MAASLPSQTPIDVLAQFDRVTDHWSPKVIARVNDQYVKVARLLGEMDWHAHADEDELFWVLRGRLRLEFRDGVAELAAGQCWVVPRGVEHHPVAPEECWVVLIETVTTRHTGDRITAQTRSIEEQLS
ncbi:MAG TPA: cupin domain-containing protein [Gemmatimonadales bacterium]|jgi:mannose-6-phosphate isomerase-like protein (cupin superfamily)|nr:cupin domain-containing protein [Gemmatimonadales bacterium]